MLLVHYNVPNRIYGPQSLNISLNISVGFTLSPPVTLTVNMSLLPPLTFALYSHKSINNTSAKNLVYFALLWTVYLICPFNLNGCAKQSSMLYLELFGGNYVYAVCVLIWHWCDVVTATITDNSSSPFDMILSVTRAWDITDITQSTLTLPQPCPAYTIHIKTLSSETKLYKCNQLPKRPNHVSHTFTVYLLV